MIKLTVFLGNYGNRYRLTRHNAAWQLAGQLSFHDRLGWKKKFKGRFAAVALHGCKQLFLKPETYMNKSGNSVQAMAHFHCVAADEIVVVHDDVELQFAHISFKQGGGLAGHNGLRSIASLLGTVEFYRMRLGVSRPARGDVAAHVLGDFTDQEMTQLPVFLGRAAEALELCYQDGVAKVAQAYAKPMSTL